LTVAQQPGIRLVEFELVEAEANGIRIRERACHALRREEKLGKLSLAIAARPVVPEDKCQLQ